jgi:hypothetical protein
MIDDAQRFKTDPTVKAVESLGYTIQEGSTAESFGYTIEDRLRRRIGGLSQPTGEGSLPERDRMERLAFPADALGTACDAPVALMYEFLTEPKSLNYVYNSLTARQRDHLNDIVGLFREHNFDDSAPGEWVRRYLSFLTSPMYSLPLGIFAELAEVDAERLERFLNKDYECLTGDEKLKLGHVVSQFWMYINRLYVPHRQITFITQPWTDPNGDQPKDDPYRKSTWEEGR